MLIIISVLGRKSFTASECVECELKIVSMWALQVVHHTQAHSLWFHHVVYHIVISKYKNFNNYFTNCLTNTRHVCTHLNAFFMLISNVPMNFSNFEFFKNIWWHFGLSSTHARCIVLSQQDVRCWNSVQLRHVVTWLNEVLDAWRGADLLSLQFTKIDLSMFFSVSIFVGINVCFEDMFLYVQ